MKQDVADIPERPPRKRRALEQAPDVWLAVWLASGDLSPPDERRVAAEKQRRRKLNPDRRLGLIVGAEGVTPAQFECITELLVGMDPTEVLHPGVASRLHMACRRLGVDVTVLRGDPQEVVKQADVVIAAPKESYEPVTKTGVWAQVRYAKHRSTPVTVVLPSGDLYRQEG